MPQHTEIDIQTLLKNAAQLQLKDLESLAKSLNTLINKKKQQDKRYSEKKLLSELNSLVLTKKEQTLYHQLSTKLEAETITNKEQKTYTSLIAKEEKLRNKRVKILITLAQLRAVSLPILMKDLGLNKVKRA